MNRFLKVSQNYPNTGTLFYTLIQPQMNKAQDGIGDAKSDQSLERAS